jgi:hypothetical protein
MFWSLIFWSLEFVSSFGIRISDLRDIVMGLSVRDLVTLYRAFKIKKLEF